MSAKISILQKPGIIVMNGSSFQTQIHQHNALQLIINLADLKETYEFMVKDKFIESSALLISANTPHKITSKTCLIVLIEAESHLADKLENRYLDRSDYYVFSTDMYNQFTKLLAKQKLEWPLVNKLLELLDKEVCLQRHIEPRIKKVLDWFDQIEQTADWESANLSTASTLATLSESRFLHLFTEQLGLPWRRYVLWRRLQAAVKYSLTGNNLTESAQQANFSDSAHFSRVFKSMFGISPSQVIKNIQWK